MNIFLIWLVGFFMWVGVMWFLLTKDILNPLREDRWGWGCAGTVLWVLILILLSYASTKYSVDIRVKG